MGYKDLFLASVKVGAAFKIFKMLALVGVSLKSPIIKICALELTAKIESTVFLQS